MLICPTCRTRLQRASTLAGPAYVCRSCSGRSVTFAALHKQSVARYLRRPSPAVTGEAVRACPMCSGEMTKVDVSGGGRRILLDVCTPCRLVWFDPGEADEVARAELRDSARGGQAAPAATAVSPSIRSRRAEVYDDDVPPGPGDDGPNFALGGAEHVWQYLPALLGMPIELGQNRLRVKPWITWSLGAALVMLFALHSAGGDSGLARIIRQWGFIPAQWGRHGGMTLITSFLLHAGWLHVLGNTYFLLIFGDNVEDHLGRCKYILLLLGSHLGGMALHAALSGDGNIPCVGASAGIAGVIAYYAIAFPRAKIGIFGWILTLFRVLRMPAMVGLVLYVGLQLYGAYQSAHGSESSVGYLAHLGGLAVGGEVGLYVRLVHNRQRI